MGISKAETYTTPLAEYFSTDLFLYEEI